MNCRSPRLSVTFLISIGLMTAKVVICIGNAKKIEEYFYVDDDSRLNFKS